MRRIFLRDSKLIDLVKRCKEKENEGYTHVAPIRKVFNSFRDEYMAVMTKNHERNDVNLKSKCVSGKE